MGQAEDVKVEVMDARKTKLSADHPNRLKIMSNLDLTWELKADTWMLSFDGGRDPSSAACSWLEASRHSVVLDYYLIS